MSLKNKVKPLEFYHCTKDIHEGLNYRIYYPQQYPVDVIQCKDCVDRTKARHPRAIYKLSHDASSNA